MIPLRFHPTPLGSGQGDVHAVALARRANGTSALAPALIARGAAEANLELLLSGKALAVTTGQQAGLFTGPMFTVLKAISAAAMAREMSAAGTPVVPVFWVAGDDHDFAEINHCLVIGADGKPVKVVLRERPADAPMLPAYREMVGNDGAAALAALEAALPPGDARTATLSWLSRAYQPGQSLAEAHAQAMAELLGPHGVVVCRGWHGALKVAARDVLLAAARQARDIDGALAAEAERLRAAGDPVPVEVGQGLSLLMLEGAQGRDRLRIDGDGRFAGRRAGEHVSVTDLERLLSTEAEKLSGNVLLRPAIEAAVFPTVGYFGGPGELAYLAQTAPVFERLGVPRPARLPRLSGMLIEPKVDKVLEKYHLEPKDLAQEEGALLTRIAREGLPDGASAALADLRAAITEHYARVQSEAVGVEKTLEKPVENARNQALVASQEIEKKIVAALKRSNELAAQQVARARDQLYPGGVAQERAVSVVSFLARYGTDVLELFFEPAQAHARALLEAPVARA